MEPKMEIEEAKARLRISEVDAEAARCAACIEVRTESGDPTAYCKIHLARIYGVR